MKNYGFIRVAAATIGTRVCNPTYNVGSIKSQIDKAVAAQASIIAFPELSISGYSCGDLFGHRLLLDKCEEAVVEIAEYSYEKNLTIIVGAPVSHNGRLYNAAVVINDGSLPAAT